MRSVSLQTANPAQRGLIVLDAIDFASDRV